MLSNLLRSTSSTPTPSPEKTTTISPARQARARQTDLTSLSVSNPLLISISTALILTSSYLGYQKFGKRIRNVDELILTNKPNKILKLKGFVTSVGDADNFRFYHKPLFKRFNQVPTKQKDLKGETLHVRLAGIDAPECSHFGKPAQPFSKEAFDYLNKTLLHKNVTIELYQKDRYSRIVSTCLIRIKKFPYLFLGKRCNVSEEMLKLGLATVYRESGAVYGGGDLPGSKKDLEMKIWFEELEKRAKAKKLGMWSLGEGKYESPADYKKRTLKE
ncbi:hypothetical protein JCM3765_006086 [Sporobolomyces pararoseus]